MENMKRKKRKRNETENVHNPKTAIVAARGYAFSQFLSSSS